MIVINYAGITGHCQIGDRATVGGLTGMVPFTRIGTCAYVGGMAKVNADVPPYMLVEGQPATVRAVNVIGLRRAGMPPAERRALQDAYRLLYRSGLAATRAVERIRDEVRHAAAGDAAPGVHRDRDPSRDLRRAARARAGSVATPRR